MSLKDSLQNLQEDRIKGCGVTAVLHSLSKDDADYFQQALDNHNISSSQLSHVLKTNGYKISARTIQRHRNAGTAKDSCACQ